MRSYHLKKYKSIEPSRVIETLVNAGWHELSTRPGIVSLWENTAKSESFKLLLPLNQDSPDYPNRMIDALRVVSEFEGKDEYEVLESVLNNSFVAEEKNRDIVSLKLTSNDNINKNEFPAKNLGFILTSLQNLIDSIGKVEAGYISSNDYIPQAVVGKTMLTVLGTAPGSFIIKFASPDRGQLDLLEKPLAEKVLNSFLDLINLSERGEREKLKELLISLNRKSLKNYKKLLIHVADSESDILVEWGSPNAKHSISAKLNSIQAIGLIDFLSRIEPEAPEIISVNAKLIGGNTERLSFEIKSLELDGQVYAGKIVPEVLKKDVDLTLENNYEFTLEETELIDTITNESTLKHTMINVNYLEGEDYGQREKQQTINFL